MNVKCTCGRKAGDYVGLMVIQYHQHHSSFGGGLARKSDYSEVKCFRAGCRGRWRTKAAYVDKLPRYRVK